MIGNIFFQFFYEVTSYKSRKYQQCNMLSTLDFGNFFLFISGFLMIHTAYKDREVLTGYNFLGTLMLATGITLVLIFYIQEGFYISTILTLPNYFYWVVVLSALINQRRKSK
jgi:hypothetical protein